MAQTTCGTPYFMPPEVCNNFPYDAKADVWAMGVIVYELITLRKPFEAPNIRGLFEKIKNQPLDPLPDGTGSDLQLVVKAVLNKDKDKRPTIFDVAKIPCINRKIEQFIEEHDCKDEVMAFFDVDPIQKNNTPKATNTAKSQPNKKKQNGEIQTYILEQLEDWADIMRQKIPIKDYPNGWFGKHMRCAKGLDIF
jgi:serine/threonine protein kinase